MSPKIPIDEGIFFVVVVFLVTIHLYYVVKYNVLCNMFVTGMFKIHLDLLLFLPLFVQMIVSVSHCLLKLFSPVKSIILNPKRFLLVRWVITTTTPAKTKNSF